MHISFAAGYAALENIIWRGNGDHGVQLNWRMGLPVLVSPTVTLRELRMSDAALLLSMLASEEVTRFIPPPPMTIDGFRRFIAWTHDERAAGRHVCFAVVPPGGDAAVGIFQARQLDPSFETAEWGVAIGSPYWGTGICQAGSTMMLEFLFEVVGVQRLEARAAVGNGRGNGALRKIGATREGVLRRSFLHQGEYLDETLWSILSDDWSALRPTLAAIH